MEDELNIDEGKHVLAFFKQEIIWDKKGNDY